MPREVGLVQAVLEAIGESDNEIGGLYQTRLTAVVAEGATTLPVETTDGWPDEGRVGLGGYVYYYTSKGLFAFNDIYYLNEAAQVSGAITQHRVESVVVDLSRTRTEIDRVRKSMLIDFADGDDLNAIGRNLGILRLPFLEDDAQYRDIIKYLAYNPKGTLLGMKLALTGLVGEGNFSIYEKLIQNPNTVFVTLTGTAATEEDSQGKSYAPETGVELADNDTQVTLDEEPLQVSSVHWADENHLSDFRNQLPSAEVTNEYDGDPGVQMWTYTNAANEGTEVTQIPDEGIEIHDSTSSQARYWRQVRISPNSYAVFTMVMMVPSTATLGSNRNQLNGHLWDTNKRAFWGVIDVDASTYQLGLADTYPNFFGSPAVLNKDQYYEVTLIKYGTDHVELRVDGQLIVRADYNDLIAETATLIGFGGWAAALTGMRVRVRQAGWLIQTPDELWNQVGTDGIPEPSGVGTNPYQMGVATPGTFNVVDDVGKPLQITTSGITNPQGGNNKGFWTIVSVPDDQTVVLSGKTGNDAEVDAAAPTRIILENNPRHFKYPDHLGTRIVVTNSGAGNDGTYTIVRLLEPGSLTDLASLDSAGQFEAETHICEVSGAAFATESDVEWQHLPYFINESGQSWEKSGGGSFSGQVLTLPHPLPLAAASNFNRVLAIGYSNVLTGQLMGQSIILNRVLQESPDLLFAYYPFYIFDPLGYVRAYLDDITAAGVIPDYTLE